MMDQGQTARELPRYRCHKEVWALKIAAIEYHGDDHFGPDGGGMITPVDTRYAPFHVDGAFLGKHKPQVGGYFVMYKDGYQSFSPAVAFEEGYTLI